MSQSDANYAYMSLGEYLAQHGDKPLKLGKASGRAQSKPAAERTDWEAELLAQMQAHGLPSPVTQYRVGAEMVGGAGRGLRTRLEQAGLKDWRLDMAFLSHKLAVEIDGGTFIQGGGGHNTGEGYERDRERDGVLLTKGWRTLRVTPKHIQNGCAVEWIASLLSARACEAALAELIAKYGEHATLGEVARATQ